MLIDLLTAFLQVGTFSIGGGYAAMPLIQALTVNAHAWLNAAEFADLVTIAEMTPGPIAVNAATFVGMRLAGWPGALAATLGCVLPSLLIVNLLSWCYSRFREGRAMQTLLATLRPVVVALIASAAVSLIRSACTSASGGFSLPGCALMLVAFIVLRRTRCSPILVMLLCGSITLAMVKSGIMN